MNNTTSPTDNKVLWKWIQSGFFSPVKKSNAVMILKKSSLIDDNLDLKKQTEKEHF